MSIYQSSYNAAGEAWGTRPVPLKYWAKFIGGWSTDGHGARIEYESIDRALSIDGKMPPLVVRVPPGSDLEPRLGCNYGNGPTKAILKDGSGQANAMVLDGPQSLVRFDAPFEFLMPVWMGIYEDHAYFVDTMGESEGPGFRLEWRATPGEGTGRWGDTIATLAMSDGSYLRAKIVDHQGGGGTLDRDRVPRASSDLYLLRVTYQRGGEGQHELSVEAVQLRSPRGPGLPWIRSSNDEATAQPLSQAIAPASLYPLPGPHPLTVGRADLAEAWSGMLQSLNIFRPLSLTEREQAINTILWWDGVAAPGL